MMLLTDAERERFASWLEQEAHTAEGLIREMLNLKGPPSMIIKMYREEAMACRVIARRLRATESQSI